MGGKTSNASINKYKAKAYDQICLLVKKGMRETYRKLANENGYTSLNAYINHLLQQELNKTAKP